MQFHLYATFRLLAGTKTLHIDLPEGTTVRQAVEAVVDRNPVLRSHWLDESGDLYPHVHIYIDGEDVLNMAQQLDSPLAAGAVLDFFPPVGGGSL